MIVYQTGNEPRRWIHTSKFIIAVALYLAALSRYFIYRLVGKAKLWWLMLACTAFTGYYVWLKQTAGDFGSIYNFLHEALAGGECDASLPFLTLVFRRFVGTGFFEELVKVLPLFMLVFAAGRVSPGKCGRGRRLRNDGNGQACRRVQRTCPGAGVPPCPQRESGVGAANER